MDFFTVPPVFVSVYLNRSWLGKSQIHPSCLLFSSHFCWTPSQNLCLWSISSHHPYFLFIYFLSRRPLPVHVLSPWYWECASGLCCSGLNSASSYHWIRQGWILLMFQKTRSAKGRGRLTIVCGCVCVCTSDSVTPSSLHSNYQDYSKCLTLTFNLTVPQNMSSLCLFCPSICNMLKNTHTHTHNLNYVTTH